MGEVRDRSGRVGAKLRAVVAQSVLGLLLTLAHMILLETLIADQVSERARRLPGTPTVVLQPTTAPVLPEPVERPPADRPAAPAAKTVVVRALPPTADAGGPQPAPSPLQAVPPPASAPPSSGIEPLLSEPAPPRQPAAPATAAAQVPRALPPPGLAAELQPRLTTSPPDAQSLEVQTRAVVRLVPAPGVPAAVSEHIVLGYFQPTVAARQLPPIAPSTPAAEAGSEVAAVRPPAHHAQGLLIAAAGEPAAGAAQAPAVPAALEVDPAADSRLGRRAWSQPDSAALPKPPDPLPAGDEKEPTGSAIAKAAAAKFRTKRGAGQRKEPVAVTGGWEPTMTLLDAIVGAIAPDTKSVPDKGPATKTRKATGKPGEPPPVRYVWERQKSDGQ